MTDTGERSAAEAAQRLVEEGHNVLPSGQRRTWRIAIWETMHAPLFLLLLAAGSLYRVSGELQEGPIPFGFVTGCATMQTATKKSGAGSRA